MRVRRAAAGDAEAIERIRTDTWRAAYRGLLPDQLLDRLGYDATHRRARLASLPSEQFALVAEMDGEVVGFVYGGPERGGDARYGGEVYAVYVMPEHQRRGAGRALLRAAAREIRGRGWRGALIWVLRENAPARGFYEHLGGVHVRDEPRDLEGIRIVEAGYGWKDVTKLER